MTIRRSQGFTVVELMIVLLLVGMITTLTLPKLRTSMRVRAVRAAGNELVLAHSAARSAALRFGRASQLHIDVPTARFWVDVDTSGTGVRDTVGFIHTLSDRGVQLASSRAVLCFDARGLAATNVTCSANDALIVLSSQSYADTVRTTTLGKVLR
jgi:type IV fimbrial biogenesis protein FimT